MPREQLVVKPEFMKVSEFADMSKDEMVNYLEEGPPPLSCIGVDANTSLKVARASKNESTIITIT